MTFETLDWEAEAERVRRAFGVEGECRWCEAITSQFLAPQGAGPAKRIYLRPTVALWVAFSERRRDFLIGYFPPDLSHFRTRVVLDWQGGILDKSARKDFAPKMSKALFHLNLLTPEVESALGVSISAHQKLEWELEYAERWGEGVMQCS